MSPPDDSWTDSPVERIVDVFVDNLRRQYFLVTVAYVAGGLGLATILLPGAWLSVREETATSVSILLMSVSFFSLFLVSVSAPGPDE